MMHDIAVIGGGLTGLMTATALSHACGRVMLVDRGSGGVAAGDERTTTINAAGARMLMKQRGFHEARVHRIRATLEHHKDHADPSGRPSLFARIIRIAEDFDNFSASRQAHFSPAVALERMVESIDSSAQRIAVSGGVSSWMMRSRIGLPYLVSPICR